MRSDVLQEIIEEYKKSKIQSEAEVRSKFIVPLITALGYPSELRAEEFPVYGYAGRDPLKAKSADYILFTDRDFADYRKKNQKCRRWVENHSLLVVEAKKPGELQDEKLEDVIGQARFYREWSRSVAYILTDGKYIYGFICNSIVEDTQTVSCNIEQLADEENIWEFAYKRLLEMKNNQLELLKESMVGDDTQIIMSEIEIDIPPETISYMKTALGKNSIGLSNYELVTKFLGITDSILSNDMRYEIPEYMLSIPRHFYKAQIFIDNSPAPCFEGEVIEYYRNDIDRYEFRNECVDINLLLIEGKMHELGMPIHILDKSVEKRINDLRKVREMLEANTLYLRFFSEDNNHTIRIPVSEAHYSWKRDKGIFYECDSWMDSLEKLKAIEDYYDIQFELEYIDGRENVEEFYSVLEFVYSGIIRKQNSYITGPKPKDIKIGNLQIDEPVFLEEIPENNRDRRTIHGITFETDRSYITPDKIRKRRGNLIVPISCECIVVS